MINSKNKEVMLILGLVGVLPSSAIVISLDYRYDDVNNFFGGAGSAQRAAMQRAADRWNAVLNDGQLGAASINPGNNGRIGFTHPGDGSSYEISGSASASTDPINGSGVADEFRTINFSADEWILYAGGRPLASAGVGGTGTGLNFTSTSNDPNSHLNRGFNVGFGSLPVWGGSISFDTGTAWDYTSDASGAGTDFYTVALHEIGHALGLAASWDDFEANVSGSDYNGSAAVAAYNADNGAALASLDLVSASNLHWEDGTYDSVIFPLGNPDYDGTVGVGVLQDLIMEPTANFTGVIDRFELTNVDVGSAADLGWDVIAVPEPSSLLMALLGIPVLMRRRR